MIQGETLKELRDQLPARYGQILAKRMNNKFCKEYIYQVMGGRKRYNTEIIDAAIDLALETVGQTENQKIRIANLKAAS